MLPFDVNMWHYQNWNHNELSFLLENKFIFKKKEEKHVFKASLQKSIQFICFMFSLVILHHFDFNSHTYLYSRIDNEISIHCERKISMHFTTPKNQNKHSNAIASDVLTRIDFLVLLLE